MKKNKSLKVSALTLAILSLGFLVPNTLITKASASDKSASSISVNASDKSTSTTVNNSLDKASIKSGWHKADNGTLNYYDETGTMVTKKWIQVNGLWHYLDANGVMVTGWHSIDGEWYHFDASGVMHTGWYNDNGKWYYLTQTGKMLSNTVIQGRYVLNKSGVCIN